jgi:hypothetical protein
MEEEKGGLRGNGDADFVGQLEPCATFEAFLVQENLDVAEQLRLVVGGQAREDGQIALDDLFPFGRKGSGAEPLAPESFALGNFHDRKLQRLWQTRIAETRSKRED